MVNFEFTRKLEGFFFASYRQESLYICRVILGLSLFAHYATLLAIGKVENTFGPDGLIGARLSAHIPEMTGAARPEDFGFQFLQNFASMETIWFLYFIILAAALLFAVGFKTRWAGGIALLLHLLFHHQNEFAYWGWGDLINPFLMYTLLGNSGRWYSVDAWISEKKWRPPTAVFGDAWPIRLIQLHVTTVYIVAAWARWDDPNWINGTMLYGILVDPLFGRIGSDWLKFKAVLVATCYTSWSIELAAPLLLWVKPTRRAWTILLITLHIGLEGLTLVGYWNFLMLAVLSSFWFRGPGSLRTDESI